MIELILFAIAVKPWQNSKTGDKFLLMSFKLKPPKLRRNKNMTTFMLYSLLTWTTYCLCQVEVSMDNLRDVVDERNSVYSVLETGEEPHPRWIDDTDELNRPIRRLEEEYIVPKEHNEEFLYV